MKNKRMNKIIEKYRNYQAKHTRGVVDYCSSAEPTPRTRRGLNAMIKFQNKMSKMMKKYGKILDNVI